MDRESDQRRAARPLVAGLAVLAVVATAAGGPAAALGTSRSSAGRHGQRPPGVAGAAARSSLGLLTPGSEQNAVTTNWSGYVLTAGQYTAINGAFTVPQVTRYVAGSTVSEWVGVDGYGNSSLVQAGVDEIPEGPGKEMVVPWWEVLPSPQVTATGVMVRVGDTVTVTLHQVSPGLWSIRLADTTDGGTFSIEHSYGGPLSSAEWVVEANDQESGASTVLAPYAPEVRFSNVEVTGAQTTLTGVTMVQGGKVVSAPTAVIAGSFSVSYQGQ